MSNRNWLSLIWSCILLISCGCNSLHPVKFDPKHRDEIKTVGILRIVMPPMGYMCFDEDYRIRQGLPTQQGVLALLIRPIISDAMGVAKPQERQAAITKVFDSQGFNCERVIFDSLKQELEKVNYITSYIEVTRADSGTFIKDYTNINSSVDAYLDVVIPSLGCCDEMRDWKKYYRPFMCVQTRLVDRKTKEVLYASYYICSSKSEKGGYVLIKEDNNYPWKTFKELTDDGPAFVKAVKDELERISAKIAEDLK